MGAPAISMFLDVATILRGQPLKRAMAVWIAWHGRAAAHTHYRTLLRCCLLGVDAKGQLTMQDLLVAMGRAIILKQTPNFAEHYGSRLWVEGGRVWLRPGKYGLGDRPCVLNHACDRCMNMG